MSLNSTPADVVAPEHPPGEAHRPLSPLERWYWIADQISPLNVIGRVRVHGTLPGPVLRAALDALQARHPLLRVAIESDEDGRDPRFRAAGGRPVPLDHRVTTETWDRVVDDGCLRDRVDWRTGPLALATVLTGPDGQTHDLILTLPHVVADGTTVIALLRQWVELADRAGDVVTRRPIPAAEELFPAAYRGAEGEVAAEVKARRDEDAFERLRPRRVEPERSVPFERRRCRLLHRSLDAGTLDRLTRVCRLRGATVHGVLAAAMVSALAEETAQPACYSIGSPMDFRGDLEPPVDVDEAGSYVATIPSLVEYMPESPLWTMAAGITQDLRARKANGEQFSMINSVGKTGPVRLAESGPFVRHLDEKGPINFCISNIGRFAFPDEIGPWRLSGAQFIAGLSVVGSFVASVNSSHHQLAWNFTYAEGIVSDARAARLADRCVEIVRSAG